MIGAVSLQREESPEHFSVSRMAKCRVSRAVEVLHFADCVELCCGIDAAAAV
jgi:hypothetical protein